MAALRIIAGVLFAAIGYGIVHDQITVRVSLEYFTLGHPPVFSTDSPTLLALGWGVLATWWVGLPLGLVVAWVARHGDRPRLTFRELVRPIAWLFATMAFVAGVSGLSGYILATRSALILEEPLATEVARTLHPRYLAARWAHSASYLIGVTGSLLLIVHVWIRRARSEGRC